MRSISITLHGKPIARVNPVKSYTFYYDPQKIYKDRTKLQLMAEHRDFVKLEGPLSLEYTFYLPMPPSWSNNKKAKHYLQYHHSKPDTSNMLKFIEDCCTGIFYKDDCQIAVSHGKKIWSYEGKTELVIKEINENEENHK